VGYAVVLSCAFLSCRSGCIAQLSFPWRNSLTFKKKLPRKSERA
jgi:hypothetical protein